MKVRGASVRHLSGPSSLTKSPRCVTNTSTMELNPSGNVHHFPIATLNTCVDKSPFGSGFQHANNRELPQISIGRLTRASKPLRHFDKGSLIDVYA